MQLHHIQPGEFFFCQRMKNFHPCCRITADPLHGFDSGNMIVQTAVEFIIASGGNDLICHAVFPDQTGEFFQQYRKKCRIIIFDVGIKHFLRIAPHLFKHFAQRRDFLTGETRMEFASGIVFSDFCQCQFFDGFFCDFRRGIRGAFQRIIVLTDDFVIGCDPDIRFRDTAQFPTVFHRTERVVGCFIAAAAPVRLPVDPVGRKFHCHTSSEFCFLQIYSPEQIISNGPAGRC